MATKTIKIGLSNSDKSSMSNAILQSVLNSAKVTITDEDEVEHEYTLPELVLAVSGILTDAVSHANLVYDQADNKYYSYGIKTDSNGELVMVLTEVNSS